ncbi:MAG: type III polyketide synthase [Cyclobacteriaceae bacterium]
MPSYISSIGVAVPKNRISQDTIGAFMERHLPISDREKQKLKVLYRASGIKHRHSVIADYAQTPEAYNFYPQNEKLEPFPEVNKRMQLYEMAAPDLAANAVTDSLEKVQLSAPSITHLVTVSCTGMYAPGLDIDLIQKLGMRTDVVRASVNFMGCYAAFNGLKIASQITESQPKAKVLVVCVELCSIHFQNTTDEDNLLSSALFADGAAAVLVTGQKPKTLSLELASFYSDLDLEARAEMSWKIGNLGFLMKLSPQVPEHIRSGIKKLTDRLLDQINLSKDQIDLYAIHPGGKRILEVIEEELGLSKMDNLPAYEILKNYGNMSSPTVLFVIKKIMDQLTAGDKGKNILSFAFGPGLTLESTLLKVCTS